MRRRDPARVTQTVASHAGTNDSRSPLPVLQRHHTAAEVVRHLQLKHRDDHAAEGGRAGAGERE